jgi:hypothetical protein
MASSQYFFNILCLGDHQSISSYLNEANLEISSQDPNMVQWHVPFMFGENNCEVDITLPVSTADYDELIGMTDGLIYFLNPNSQPDIDLFQQLMEIIIKFRRDISTIIVFKDKDGLIRPTSNEIFEWLWSEYQYEGYIADFGSQNQFREILNEFTYCIMTGQPLINYDTAWLEIPVLYKNINKAIGMQNWNKASKLAKKLYMIANRFGLMDQNIIAEQGASLYLKANEDLEAAELIKHFNPIHQELRKNYYTQLINEGKGLSNAKKFMLASQKFEYAANYAGLELNEASMRNQALKFAIENWIQACEVQNAYRLLDHFDANEINEILEGLTEKIANTADYLISVNQEEHAKTILYLSFDRFQRAGLFESLKVLSTKVIKILMIILDRQLRANQMNEAKLTLDELYNIWESYNIKPDNIDPYLQKIIRLFIKARDFSKVDSLIPKIQSLEVKQILTTELANEVELKQNQQKQADSDDVIKSLDCLMEYIKEEAMLFYQFNQQIYEKAEQLEKGREFQKAANLLFQHASWLKNIRQEQLYYDVIEQLNNIYLHANDLDALLKNALILPEEMRKRYLSQNINSITSVFIQIQKQRPYEEIENLATNYIKIYRNLLLYNESKLIAKMLADFLIKTGLEVELTQKQNAIDQSIALLHKSEQVCQAYLDTKAPESDPLLVKIVEYYIVQGNLTSARQYNERLNDKRLSLQFNNKIEEIEHSKVGKLAQKALSEQSKKIDAEQISQLRITARDQRLMRENILRMRTGLKKRYFQIPLDFLIRQNFSSAAENYINIAQELIRGKKFELASISAAIGEVIYLYTKEFNKIHEKMNEIDRDLGMSTQLYHDTFPIKLVDYIVQMYEMNLIDKAREALELHEVLALFPEESLMFEALLGLKPNLAEALKNFETAQECIEKDVPSNYKTLIQKLVLDPALNTKRNSFESKYWASTNDEIAAQNYEAASNLYLASVDEFLNRNLDVLARVSVIMAMLSLLKVKSATTVQTELEKVIFKETKRSPGFNNSLEFKLFEIFLDFFDKSDKIQEIREIGQAFYEKLPLLDWEKSFVLSFIKSQEKGDDRDQIGGTISITSSDQIEDDTLVFQQMVVLSQQLNDLKPVFDDLAKKRELGKRTYYEEIFIEFKNQNYLEAADKYIKLAKRMARRNDYELAAIMFFLSTLCNIKANIKFIEIKNKIDQELTSLGLVKKILDDTFGVKIAFFILDALKIDDPSIKINLKSIFLALPILAEEQFLTSF